VYDIGTAGLPARVPDADGLGGDAELAGDLSLADTSGEQLGRAEPVSLEPVACSLCRRAGTVAMAGSLPAAQDKSLLDCAGRCRSNRC
jgi:hypothetical protein